MKRIVFIALLLATAIAASGQTALYKHFANRPGVQAYCVERYPLTSGDSVCVTLLQTDDTAVYRSLISELRKLPYSPRRKSTKGTVSQIKPQEQSATSSLADSVARIVKERKHLVIFNADGLPGDRGYYTIYCPSDRMVVLAFMIRDEKEARKISKHMMATEF